MSRRRFVLLAVILLAAAGALAAVVGWFRYHGYAPGEVRGHDAPIRLIAVWPDNSLELRDPAGEVIGETTGTADWPWFQHYDTSLTRNFIFAFEGEAAQYEPAASTRFVYGRGNTREYITGQDAYPLKRGANRLCIRVQIPRTYAIDLGWLRRFYSRRIERPVKTIDFTLRYRAPERGEARMTFLGPFEAGGKYAAEEDAQGVIEVSRYYGLGTGGGTRMRYKGPAVAGRYFEGLWYDRSGRRRLISGSTPNKAWTDVLISIEGCAPQDITAVTLGEEAFEKTFHNIRVAYPGYDDDATPECLVELAERLGIEGDILENHEPFTGVDDVVKTADLLRGRFLEQAVQRYLRSADPETFENLGAEDKARVTEAAETLSSSEDEATAAHGIMLGLLADFDAFFDRAADLLETGVDEERIRLNARGGWGYSGEVPSADKISLLEPVWRRGGALSDQQAARLATIVLGNDFLWSAGYYMDRSFERGPSRPLLDIYVKAARDERPWYWWRALRKSSVAAELGPFESWPRELGVRYLIANDFSDEAVAAFPDLVGEAEAALPRLLTPEFRNYASYSGGPILDLIATRLPAAEATQALADFATMNTDFRNNYGNIVHAIALINRINGIDIGGYGPPPAEGFSYPDGLSLAQAVDQLRQWRETGALPVPVQDGYRAGPKDLRVVCRHNADPEAVCIALWLPPADDSATGYVWWKRFPGGVFCYRFGAADPFRYMGGPPVDYMFEARITDRLGQYPQTEFVHEEGVVLSALPLSPRASGDWLVTIEKADSPTSVLSGTKVFGQWWAMYGPLDFTAAQD